MSFKTWGPVVQALAGLTFTTGLPGEEPAGYGFSYMDHGAALSMVLAILAALHHRERTGEGQWIDIASTQAGAALLTTEILDWTVNGRSTRRAGEPHGNRADFDEMAPHGAYPAAGDDRWVTIACRDDRDWTALAELIGETWTDDARFADLAGRIAHADQLDQRIGEWTRARDADEVAAAVLAAGVPASVVKSPPERIDDEELTAWGLFPEVDHPEIGRVRVEGLPLHLTETDWTITAPAPLLGEHTREVLSGLLGRSDAEIDRLAREGAI
jgi:crotonobetainyl-CoA:carnitine CoA-transferase CaiB-like acyl-CoA transferase